jgi:hypothetical protein
MNPHTGTLLPLPSHTRAARLERAFGVHDLAQFTGA